MVSYSAPSQSIFITSGGPPARDTRLSRLTVFTGNDLPRPPVVDDTQEASPDSQSVPAPSVPATAACRTVTRPERLFASRLRASQSDVTGEGSTHRMRARPARCARAQAKLP